MGFLFRIFLIALGIYYLFKLLTGKSKEVPPKRETFASNPNEPSRHTDKSTKQEGEYVDFEEVD